MNASYLRDSRGRPGDLGRTVQVHDLRFVHPGLMFSDIEIDGVTYTPWRVERHGATFVITPPLNARHIYAAAHRRVLFAFRAAWLLRTRSMYRPAGMFGESATARPWSARS